VAKSLDGLLCQVTRNHQSKATKLTAVLQACKTASHGIIMKKRATKVNWTIDVAKTIAAVSQLILTLHLIGLL
jgi:hypothetical protein